MKKVVLVSKSEGNRGANGKKKIYEIVIDGNRVTFSWGKAEESARQTKTQWLRSEWLATQTAEEKKWEKIAKGYEVAFIA